MLEGSRYDGGRLAASLILAGMAARLALSLINPPPNSYDDHMVPIAYYATELARPDPRACWECYQPPVYYILSALVLRAAWAASHSPRVAWHAVQLVSAAASCLNLVLCWKVLRIFGPADGASRVVAIGLLSLFPLDLMTSGFISNDALLVLWVSLAVWGLGLCEVAEGPSGRLPGLLLLCAGSVLAAWTKQSGLVALVLPLWALCRGSTEPARAGDPGRRPRRWEIALLLAAIPLALSDELWRYGRTGHFLASNQLFFDAADAQPPGDLRGVCFWDFRFFRLMKHPILHTEPTTLAVHGDAKVLGSFWTEFFARLWFDFEPRYLRDSFATRQFARLLYLAGAGVVAYGLAGIARLARSRCRAIACLPLALLACGFLCVPVVQTMRYPHFSSMKATFSLPAISAFITLFALATAAHRGGGGGEVSTKGVAACVFVWLLMLAYAVLILTVMAPGDSAPLWPYPPLGAA